jgi:hemolysin III
MTSSFTTSQRMADIQAASSHLFDSMTGSIRLSQVSTASVVAPISTGSYLPSRESLTWPQWLEQPAQPTRTAEEAQAEERMNCLTHGIGVVASLIGLVYLLHGAMQTGGTLRMLGCGVYGVSMVLLYTASTLLHGVSEPKLKKRFQAADHVCIYLLIAGTYTPFLLTLMQNTMGWTLFGCVWTLAAAGISIKLRYADRLDETSAMPYVGLGWIALAAIKPLLAAVPMGGMMWLIAGGISYSIGVIFFHRDDQPYFHAIWHVFVLAGSACHFAAVMLYVAT